MQINSFLDLCSGIGGGRLGLEQAGMHSIGYCDTSRLAVTTYQLMFDVSEEKKYANLKRIKTHEFPLIDFWISLQLLQNIELREAVPVQLERAILLR